MVKKNLYLLLISVLVGCSQADQQCLSFAESWNRRCPLTLIQDEISMTGVNYMNGDFILSISLSEIAPASVSSLINLDKEYSKRAQETDCDIEIKEIGGLPFAKGLMSKLRAVTQIVDSIALLTYTPESTQGEVSLLISISDGIDSFSYRYSEDWELPSEYEWLNAIMPIEMCNLISKHSSSLPPLNDIVEISGIPRIGNDGLMRIYCSYDADPAYTRTGKPMSIGEIRKKYFNKKILENYLTDRMNESKEVNRYLNACCRRGVEIKFIVDGFKDGIDYDLASPEHIKRWESWGGSDSITISLSNVIVK